MLQLKFSIFSKGRSIKSKKRIFKPKLKWDIVQKKRTFFALSIPFQQSMWVFSISNEIKLKRTSCIWESMGSHHIYINEPLHPNSIIIQLEMGGHYERLSLFFFCFWLDLDVWKTASSLMRWQNELVGWILW